MGDHIARAEEFEKKAEKKLSSWGFFGSKHEDAAELFDKSANSYKLGKSWDKAGATYVKLANCHLKSDSKHEAATAYVDAAHCYKKSSVNEAISCLEQAVNLLCDIGRLNMAARYYKEIAELYESEQNIEKAIEFFERAADFFQNEEVTTSANQCKQKVAQFAAQIEQYPKSIEIYEEIARHSLNNNLLKYGVKGHLLNAGICQLCKGDSVAITNALERYQDFDIVPYQLAYLRNVCTYAGIRSYFFRNKEYRFLADIAASVDEEDVAKFTDVVKEFDSMTPLDSWKTTLLLRVKEKLKSKELEEDDLT
ncbi:alpha-soluble NSF attachment protein 2 [Prunus dulcis]|uniref:Alpha-soluble NSF attachment protein 2 n=1 Tax=Prunus dulcis TaxID=3755 RepID=A0A4Y1R229_PRUDU|nr:alpha-soluble NSF attachment protein 2 [Prunus dulcis]